MKKKEMTKKEKKEFEKQKEKEDRQITDDLVYHFIIKLLIGAIIFYFTYTFFVSQLIVSTFFKISLIVFFEQIADIISIIVAYFLLRAISDKLQHSRKSFKYLNGNINWGSIMFQIWNMTINAIFILLGFYVLLKTTFYDNYGIMLLSYIVIRIICVLLAFFISKLAIKYRRSKIAICFMIFTIVFYVIILIVAICFLFI